MYKFICEECYKEFESGHKNRKFCSWSCAGKKGGRNGKGKSKGPSWNKRKTSETDSRIRSGMNNPCYGKKWDEDRKLKHSQNLKGINKGDANGMKKPESRINQSLANVMRWERGDFDNKSEEMKQLWKSGKMDGVKVGRCKWYTYEKKNGIIIKLQGTWELAFAKWADEQKLTFDSHSGCLRYEDKEGNSRFYYPDFFVHEWNCYVEIKNDYHFEMQLDKFEMIKKHNPDITIKMLRKQELLNLGIKLR